MTHPDTKNQIRRQISRTLEQRADGIVGQVVAVFPYATAQSLDTDRCARLCEAALYLLSASLRDDAPDAHVAAVGDLRRLSQEAGLSPHQLFDTIYLLERAALDELALDDTIGAESDQWNSIAQVVHRATFGALAAYADRVMHEPAAGALVDSLTTLTARSILEAVLEKELRRAERLGHPLAVIAFDVDRLGEINASHGYGFGDRVLERIGIVMRNFFREQDWVCRFDEDTFVVLLPETMPEYAELLAERVRLMVEERLALRDYRTDERVQVTVSVAVVIAAALDSRMNREQMMRQAELGLLRAKDRGRNRVEKVDVSSTSLSVLGTARYLGLSQDDVLALVKSGQLAAQGDERSLRFDRLAVESLRGRTQDQRATGKSQDPVQE